MDRITTLLELVEADPADALTRFMLGQELIRGGRAMEAIPHLEEAVRLDPDHTASQRELGQAYLAAGRPDDARDTWTRGMETAERTGDIQTGKQMRVFLAKLK